VRPELTAALQLALQLSRDELPRLLGDLAEVHAVALSRLLTPAPPEPADTWLDVGEVCARLHCSPSFVYRHAKELRARKFGGALRFPAAALEKREKPK